MHDTDSEGMFQGNELSRLLVLLAIAVGGWGAIWYYVTKAPAGKADPDPVVNGKPRAVEPDRSIEFETVTDKTTMSFRDTAAYSKLLTQARDATPARLAARARRDVFYAHLWDQPREFRGVPVHLDGTARRVLYYKSKMSRTGWLYEAWLFTPDGQNNPYVCVFEDAPKGFPIGANLSERVVFNGYFLKLMRYEAGDVPRAAPMVVGRIGWTRPVTPVTSNHSVYWLGGAIAVMFSVSMFRRVSNFRRSLAPKARPSFVRDRPTEEIAPEELADYFGNPPDDLDEPPHDARR